MAINTKQENWLAKSTKSFLVGIGKPFYFIFAYIFISLVVFVSIVKNIKIPKFLPRLILVLYFSVLIIGGSSIYLFWIFILKDLPSPMDLLNRNIEVSTKIYDRNGVLLYKVYKNKNRTIVPISDIPVSVKLATIAAEDAEFYSHPGFSIKGIFRAIRKNLETGELTGGSTITQQLVKNALLTPEKTLSRKLKEIVLSIKVELEFSKDTILEMYLNDSPYGGSAYGISEASEVYFGKDVENLSLAEAALLAGLPKSPTKFSPFGASPELAISRQKEVLKLMEVNTFITHEQKEEAERQTLTFAQNKIDIKAPHFVMFVRKLLEEKYGTEILEKGGLEVKTTLDYSIQEIAEKIVKKEINKLANFHVTNAAVIVLNPKTAEILAMVGSRDYFDSSHDGAFNVTTSPRQPGSSIKVVNYAKALSTTYTPASLISDSPVTFEVPGQPPYTPKNYDSEYRGTITIRSALAESRNIPAVKVLASYGVSKMIEMGRNLGITTWEDQKRFGLSLTLGGGEVKLIDLANVYATIANYGHYNPVSAIISVKNYKAEVLEESQCTSFYGDFGMIGKVTEKNCKDKEVLDPRVAFSLTDILKDNNARSPSFGSFSKLVVEAHPEVAVKTGTSNDLRDNLTVGFSPNFLVAVWVGNNDNTPMARIASGITGAAPIWNEIISNLLTNKASLNWEVPKGLVQIHCPIKSEWFLVEKYSKSQCDRIPTGEILEPAAHSP